MAGENLNAGANKRMDGRQSQRIRNTQTSNAARDYKKPPTVPGLGEGFSSAAGITSGLAGAWGSLQNTLASMRQQRLGFRAQFKTDRAAARAEAIGGMSEAINAGIEGGMTGSSSVGQARIGVLADRRAAIEASKGELKQAVLGTKVAEQEAVMQYEIAENSAMMQAAALRQQQAIADAALAAQEQGNANMLAYMESQQGDPSLRPGQTFMGGDVKDLGNGMYEVRGVRYDPTTTTPAMLRKTINANLAANTYIGNRTDWDMKGQR